jgi:hypothetical protein
MIACGKAAHQLHDEQPTVLVEVLSPPPREDGKGKLRVLHLLPVA